MAGAESTSYVVSRATWILEELDNDLPYFQNQMLPDFIASRTKVVEYVGELKDKIYYVSVGGSGGRLAGATAGIAGGLATIVGIAMSLSGKANGESFMRAGNGLSILGGVTSASATLLELGFTHKYMNEIKQALKDDQKLANDIYTIINRSRALNLLLTRLFGYSILSDSGRTIVLVCHEVFKILRNGNRALNHLIQEIENDKQLQGETDVIDMTEQVAERVVEFLLTLMAHPETLESYRTIIFLLKENPQVFELAKFSLQVFLQLRNIGGLEGMLSLLSLAGPATSSGALLAQGGFQSIMIALNFVTFVFAARDIETGKSKYCDLLESIKEALAAELRVAKELHRAAIAS